MRQVVLIGPVCVGKTTLLPVLATRLGQPCVDLDDIAERYYEEVGKGRDELNAVGAARGDLGAYLWWQEAHPHAVRRVLENHPDAVIALGAGHTTYADPVLFDEVSLLLSSRFVVLLLPSPDPDRSLRTLRQRATELNGMDWLMDGVDVLDQWVSGEQNRRLASLTVFTEGRDLDDIADEVIAAVRERT